MCAFYDKVLKNMETIRVSIPTGGIGGAPALKLACNDVAFRNGFSHWAQPATLEPNCSRWLIFECGGLARRVYLDEKPTQEAAEMWLRMRV